MWQSDLVKKMMPCQENQGDNLHIRQASLDHLGDKDQEPGMTAHRVMLCDFF